ncbi:hypothetical protein C7377_0517 [Balneicella halophila]|uniref:Porin n=1 Tax=Balneicella halophila TaxID=1537566 RepID=A0A7L4UR30_BALHA|nr:hypothetical protein [Balneicella halophila]PVX52210.1 hypothetical protein C7377_0517 [Balneicella halophila]
MKKFILFIIASLSAINGSFGQTDDKVKVELSGFISAKFFYDTREGISSRNGDFLFYPAPEIIDDNGNDLNDVSKFHFNTLHSRLRVKTTSFSLWGGSLSSYLEADFYGISQGDIGQFRIRHAYLDYKRNKSNLIVGQYWHPMFVTSCYPTTSLISLGTPGGVLSRNPQIRYTYHFTKDIKASITALSQLNFKSDGPQGASADYISNSGIPEFNLHIEAKPLSQWTIGAVGGTKKLVPRTVNDENNKVDESIQSYHLAVYSAVKTSKMEYKLQGIYAENGNNMRLLGGYAVSGINQAKGEYNYTPIASLSSWGEIVSHYPSLVNFGLFAAYSKNLGASEEVIAENGVYTRGKDINQLFKVAPRISLQHKTFKIIAEITQIYADYGTPNVKMKVKDTNRVGLTRFQLHVLYNF